ncbi:MAG TPA: hypothetical protein VGB20_02105 [bacterium]
MAIVQSRVRPPVARMSRTRLNGKVRPAWVGGTVDKRRDHVSVSYGEARKAVALVAPHRTNGFVVDFQLKPRRNDERGNRILDAVRRELTFYLQDVVGPDSWSFVKYHCETPANYRSIVHWRWHPSQPHR